MTLGWRTRIRMLIAYSVVSTLLIGWAVTRSPVPDLADRWPDPRRLEDLAAFAGPAPEMPDIEDYSAHLPALPAPVAPPSAPVDEPPAPVAGGWRVSAILISGGRPVAIVDDQQVRPGDRLPDGTMVERIETSRVVLRDVRGGLHTLRVGD